MPQVTKHPYLPGIAHHAQVDIAGGARAVEAELEHDTALEERSVAEGLPNASEESIEDEQLPKPIHVHAVDGGVAAHADFEGDLEGLRRSVLVRGRHG
jgi:hypothetical protein